MILDVAVNVNTNVTTKTDEISFTIINYGTSKIGISPVYRIQKQESGVWVDLDTLDNFNIEIVQLIFCDGKPQNCILPVAKWYGYLSEGNYRLIVDSGSKMAFGLFSVREEN